eukprot:6211165-Pleurochrysis_carterae.AAC.3
MLSESDHKDNEPVQDTPASPNGDIRAPLAPQLTRIQQAALAWAAARAISIQQTNECIVLDCDEQGHSAVPDDSLPLLQALRSAGMRLEHHSWKDTSCDWDAARLVLPFGCWDYAGSAAEYAGFLARLRQLRQAGAQPSADLLGIEFCSHKRCHPFCRERICLHRNLAFVFLRICLLDQSSLVAMVWKSSCACFRDCLRACFCSCAPRPSGHGVAYA